jgi:hypothetical protein
MWWHFEHRHWGPWIFQKPAQSPANKRARTTSWIVRYDQKGPAAGTRAAMRSSTTAKTSQNAANIQTQPTYLTAFDPHF